jgi:hypothetical protein
MTHWIVSICAALAATDAPPEPLQVTVPRQAADVRASPVPGQNAIVIEAADTSVLHHILEIAAAIDHMAAPADLVVEACAVKCVNPEETVEWLTRLMASVPDKPGADLTLNADVVARTVVVAGPQPLVQHAASLVEAYDRAHPCVEQDFYLLYKPLHVAVGRVIELSGALIKVAGWSQRTTVSTWDEHVLVSGDEEACVAVRNLIAEHVDTTARGRRTTRRLLPLPSGALQDVVLDRMRQLVPDARIEVIRAEPRGDTATAKRSGVEEIR